MSPIAYGQDYPDPYADDAAPSRRDELAAALLEDDGLRRIPEPEQLIAGWLERDSIAWCHGKPGHAKTFLAIDFACAVSTGTDWHGHAVTQGPVVYIIAEGAGGLTKRLDAWLLGHGHRRSGVQWLPVPVQLLDASDLAALVQLLAEIRPALIVIDTQARVTLGMEENSAKDAGYLVDALEQLRTATRACLLLVHHEPRNGESLRGSTALEGAATTIIRVSKDGPQVTITNTKQKNTAEAPELVLTLRELGESAALSHDQSMLTKTEDQLLTVVSTDYETVGASASALKDATGLTKPTLHRALKALRDKGLVTMRTDGRYPVYRAAAKDQQLTVSTVSPPSHSDGESRLTSHTPLRGETVRRSDPETVTGCAECQRRSVFDSGPCPIHQPKDAA